MKSIGRLLKFTSVVQASVIVCLFVAVRLILAVSAPPPPAMPQSVSHVGGGESYLTQVSTDKPIYRTGEKVYVRGVVLSAGDHIPLQNSQVTAVFNPMATFEIKGPKGETVTSGTAAMIDSVVGFSWDVPANQAGGEYTVRILQPWSDVPAERKFDVRAYRAPRLKSQIVFARDGYGPADTVGVNLHVERAEGGIPSVARVSVSARVDGEEIWKGETHVDAFGNAAASFKLPESIARGEGVVAMTIQDGGVIETATKTIPILLQSIDLAIYPEGGDLVAGLQNRVYIEGRTPSKKPADTAGIIVDDRGRQVAAFRSEHEGRGRFSFVPAKNESYFLHVTAPAGIKTVFPLPAVKSSGVVLSTESDVTPRAKDVVVRVATTEDGAYGLALSERGKELAFRLLALKANQPASVAFAVPNDLDGVIVATVYNDHKTPIAERLLFRQPEHPLRVRVSADQSEYVPGDKVTLRVATTTDEDRPVGAVVGLTVTDSSVLEMIETREQAPRLPVMVLLENDVRNLSDAHVYLDETNAKAPLATDLLLGTQGWRRFATVDPAKFLTTYDDAARRVLAGRSMGERVAGMGFLNGVIVDATNALIPGVTVRAINAATGVTVATTTNESGGYVFPALIPGTYQLTAWLPGFQTTNVTGLRLAPNSSARQDIRLQIANMDTKVEVRAVDIRKLAPAAAAVGAVLPENRVRDLPIVGNNVLDLIQVLPGVRAEKEIARDGIALAGLRGQLVADVAQQPLRVPIVREYAHTLRPGWTEGSRADFAETVYWNAGVKTDATNGTAKVSFNLSDSVTAFRVLADGFTADGMLGSGVNHVESVQPFSIEPKIPLQVTSGDTIKLPIGIVNGTNRELRGVEITSRSAAGLEFTMLGNDASTLQTRERARRLLQINIAPSFTGSADLTIDGKAGSFRDSVTRKLDVRPLGFPYERSTSGLMEKNGSKSFNFTIPDAVVRGSVSTSVVVYPTPLASMTEALQSFLHEPYGCFEQTSSTSYPMVMAQQYFLTHTGIDPAIVEKTRGLLDISYKKLTAFETRSKGYEWFGADPGHEALTAYGLMQFADMSQVRAVDKDMLDRTRAWLLSRRDGHGGFSLNAKALDSFGRAPADTANAYIVWALIESGEKGLEKEIAAVKASANSTQDSYIVALAANILYATGDRDGAGQLMDKLVRNQDTAGNVKGAVTSITRSGGDALAIETTALSALAWMRDPAYSAQVEKSLRWIVESNKSGRFGSTQSTILALRSIVAYDKAHALPKAPGRLILTVDGRTAGAPVDFTPKTQGALVLPDFRSELGPGKHTVALRMEDGSSMPYSISVKYNSTLPDSAEQTKVGIRVTLQDMQVREGNVTEAMVSIANKSDEAIPTPVAIVGIPGGLEVRHDQLKELVKSGKIDAYEVIGREVVLYWRYLKAKDTVDLPLSLVAAVPGTYTGPASRAYLYYTDEYKNWASGIKVTITPR